MTGATQPRAKNQSAVMIYACTDRGLATAVKVRDVLINDGVQSVEIFASQKRAEAAAPEFDVQAHAEGVNGFARDGFDLAKHKLAQLDVQLIFVASTGIAVRAIAPIVSSKTNDPGVSVLDEAGEVLISLLSGHLGGSVSFCERLASLIEARPIVTTATDKRGVTAVDTWAREQGMTIENPREIVSVSSAKLHQEPVAVVVSELEMPAPYPHTLFVRPQNIVIGVGCKRAADPISLRNHVLDTLAQEAISPESVCAIASIDIKTDEPACIELAQYFHVKFMSFTAQELEAVQGSFSSSDVVKSRVGVDNVCERACMAAVGGKSGGCLVVPKRILSGCCTVAVARMYPGRMQAKHWKMRELT